MKIKIGSQWIADGGMRIEIVEKLEHGRFEYKHLNGCFNGIVSLKTLMQGFEEVSA